jgi:hypothetical protein
MKRLTGELVIPSPNNMASIYEKVPLYKVVKAWDDNNPNLSEVYKLKSNNLQSKSRIEIYKDNEKYGIKFTINKMIPELNKGAEKCDLNSLIAIGPYMANRFSWALFEVDNFWNFCLLTTFDSSKCS